MLADRVFTVSLVYEFIFMATHTGNTDKTNTKAISKSDDWKVELLSNYFSTIHGREIIDVSIRPNL